MQKVVDVVWAKPRILADVEVSETPESFLALLSPRLERISLELVIRNVKMLQGCVFAEAGTKRLRSH